MPAPADTLSEVDSERCCQSVRLMGQDEPLEPTPGSMTMHAGLANGRWWTLTLAEQLGNAGADVGRAIRAREEGDQGRFDAALDRALELLDLTLADPRWSGPRLREIAHA